MGRYVSTGVFDLILSFRHAPSDDDLIDWQEGFQKASELLFAATEGRHQLRQIWFCIDSGGGSNADFWCLGVQEDCLTNARIWEPYLHGVMGFQTRLEPFTIVHELGHYLYALGDEYKHAGGDDYSSSCVGAGTSTTEPKACIMEASAARGDHWDEVPGGDKIWKPGEVFQFCTAANHESSNPTEHTVQHTRHEGLSCWETIHKFYEDIDVPTVLSDVRVIGTGCIEWRELANEKRYVIAADLSGLEAIGHPAPMRYAEKILSGFARTAPRNQFFGAVLSYQGKTRVGEIASPFRRGWLPPPGGPDLFSAVEEVDALDTAGMLRAAGRLAHRPGNRAATQVVGFISWGDVDLTPEAWSMAGLLRDRGTRLYTFGAAPCAQAAELASLAALTGGTFARFSRRGSSGGRPLRTELANLYEITQEEGGLVTVEAAIVDTANASLPGAASGGAADSELVCHEFSSVIEGGCEHAVFTLEWPGDTPLELVVISPDGEAYREPETDTLDRDPEETYRAIDVDAPTAGTWLVRVVLRDGEEPGAHAPTEVLHRVHVGPSRVHFALSAPKPVFTTGETVRVLGQVTAGCLVETDSREKASVELLLSGLRMRGTLTDPAGRASMVDLSESARSGPGGRGERSGCHRLEFTATVPGPYELVVVADNLRESAVIADRGDTRHGDRRAVEPPTAFVRHASLTVVVVEPEEPG